MEIDTTKRPRKAATKPSSTGTMRDDVRAFKREIILAAAVDAFYSQGFENTSVDDIAAAMSVTKAVLYYNFASKLAVLETIVDRTAAWSLEAIERGIAQGATPAQKLALLAFHSTAHILEHQKLVATIFARSGAFLLRCWRGPVMSSGAASNSSSPRWTPASRAAISRRTTAG